MISAAKYGFLSLNGSLWSIQFVGFSLGLIINTILNYYLMDEGINLKTIISILLAFCIITIQFWK
jgi:heme/copper-type cytochrome/quinol oxidase subunit 4